MHCKIMILPSSPLVFRKTSNIPLHFSFTADRRAVSVTTSIIAGIRKLMQARALPLSSSISTALPATGKTSPTAFPATGVATHLSICNLA